ncbi:MAG: efflux RND transporter periplasmic adaptor subunit [Planctomycetes bacterium]|nr:efflux RND transporter periplasmic adaptor subunit [Planctomycetota bacterium]
MIPKVVKTTVMILIGLAILAAIAFALMPKPVESEFARATRGSIRVTVDQEARTRVKDRFIITAPVAGMMSRISLKAGDVVEIGMAITTLSPSQPMLLDARAKSQAQANIQAAEANQNQAQSNVEAAQAQLELAVKEHSRMQTLLKGKHVSQEDVDAAATKESAAKAALDSAKFGKQAADFQVEMAKATLIEDNAGAELPKIEIRSPVAGRVLRVYRDSAGAVMPGEMLLELGDPASLEIVADVLSSDAVRAKPGMPVSIERWGGSEPLDGFVRIVEPSGFTKISSLGVEEQRVNVIIDFGSGREKWQRLGDGFRVEARLILMEVKDVVKVPTGALFVAPEGDALFVVADGKATRRIVKVGARNGLEAEVKSGLNDGDTVIVHPSDEIEDGTKVAER